MTKIFTSPECVAGICKGLTIRGSIYWGKNKSDHLIILQVSLKEILDLSKLYILFVVIPVELDKWSTSKYIIFARKKERKLTITLRAIQTLFNGFNFSFQADLMICPLGRSSCAYQWTDGCQCGSTFWLRWVNCSRIAAAAFSGTLHWYPSWAPSKHTNFLGLQLHKKVLALAQDVGACSWGHSLGSDINHAPIDWQKVGRAA